MIGIRDKIKLQVEELLSSKDEYSLEMFSSQLSVWNYKENPWYKTSELEKNKIREVFKSMESAENRIDHANMKVHLSK